MFFPVKSIKPSFPCQAAGQPSKGVWSRKSSHFSWITYDISPVAYIEMQEFFHGYEVQYDSTQIDPPEMDLPVLHESVTSRQDVADELFRISRVLSLAATNWKVVCNIAWKDEYRNSNIEGVNLAVCFLLVS